MLKPGLFQYLFVVSLQGGSTRGKNLTVTLWPARLKDNAAAKPAIPPPTMVIFKAPGDILK